MKEFLLGALLGVGLGVAATAPFLRPMDRAGPGPASGTDPDHSSGPGAPPPARLAGPAGDGQAILDRLASMEAELRRVAGALDALARGGAAGAAPSPGLRPGDEGAGPGLSAAEVRAVWAARLDELERSLRSHGPRPDVRDDVVLWSHWDDLDRARRSLAEAVTLEDLQRLSEGEFERTFRWP